MTNLVVLITSNYMYGDKIGDENNNKLHLLF